MERIVAEAGELRGDAAGEFDLVVDIAPDAAASPWEEVGATWVLTSFDPGSRLADVEAAIESGPIS